MAAVRHPKVASDMTGPYGRRSLAGMKAILLLLLLGACVGSAPDVTGVWEGASANAEGWVLEFASDGSARWTVPQGTLDVRYRFDPSQTPHHLDLSGFTSGPLQGRTLYGIMEFDGAESFRWDAQPGEAEQENARPLSFVDDETRVMRRRVSTSR